MKSLVYPQLSVSGWLRTVRLVDYSSAGGGEGANVQIVFFPNTTQLSPFKL